MFSRANYSFLRNTHCGSIFLHVRIERTIGERQRRNMLVLLRRVCGHEVRLPPGLRGVDTASRVNAYKASLLCSDTYSYGYTIEETRRHQSGKSKIHRRTKTYRSLIARRNFTTRRDGACRFRLPWLLYLLLISRYYGLEYSLETSVEFFFDIMFDYACLDIVLVKISVRISKIIKL